MGNKKKPVHVDAHKKKDGTKVAQHNRKLPKKK